jgi:hypothetical protein
VRDKRAPVAGGGGELAHKALRAMRRYTVDQLELNARVHAALEEHARRLDDLNEQIRRARHGIAATRRRGLSEESRGGELEARVEALEARLAPDEPGDDS